MLTFYFVVNSKKTNQQYLNMKNNSKFFTHAILILIFSITLVSCGGGGSGGSTSNPPVTLAISSPANISSTSYTGSAIPSVTISATVNGDVQTLNGKSIYVLIESPDQLFDKNPAIALGTGTASLTLNGMNDIPKGDYNNSLKIFVCLDPNCKTQLGNSPLILPYSIKVKQGIALTQKVADISTTFGVTPAPIAIPITLAEPGKPFNVVRFDGLEGSQNSVVASPDGQAKLIVQPSLGWPGKYVARYRVSQEGVAAPGATFELTYTIIQDLKVRAAANPSEVTIRVKYFDSTDHTGSIQVVGNPGTPGLDVGGHLTAGFIDKFEVPPIANGHPNANNWIWYQHDTYVIHACGDRYLPNCLPPGTYKATIGYDYNGNDRGPGLPRISERLLVPITMIISN
ncbi:hypothetical protein [Undibacterium flavidum]|uniref:Lipoprotein n=1 Tax=Undibacterium flavidum TaxID=2762297 RepID=A0ABR6YHQ1_9BURK|nr:hypothetical protein [Undibacterium flavidum]MBC3876111.1 hypothetical protein [Undibacterium flavidum]